MRLSSTKVINTLLVIVIPLEEVAP